MVVAAVGVATAAYGAYSANQNAKAQSAAMGQQQNAANANLALEQQYMHDQEKRYGPLMDEYVQQASGGSPLDYGLESGAIQGNYDQAQRNLQGQLAARGLSASGLASAGATGLEIGRASALGGAFQQGLDRRRQLGLSVLQHYNPQGAVQGVSGAYGNQQQLYGQYGQMYGQAAQAGYGAAAQGLGAAAQAYGASQTPQAAAPATPAPSIYTGNPATGQAIGLQPTPFTQQGMGGYLPSPLDQQTAYDPNATSPFGGQGYFPPTYSPGTIGYGDGTSTNSFGIQ